MRASILIWILVALIVLSILFARPIKQAMTRGYANKNPGNIRITFKNVGGTVTQEYWQGEIKGRDKDFKTFKSMEYGYRAIFVLLRTYISKGLNTIEKIVSTYAPHNENDTNSYIRAVELVSKIPRNTLLSFSNKEDMIKIVKGISLQENCVTANESEIRNGLKLL